MKRKLNIAMIGHRFMGKAHSNAWRQVRRFFDVPVEPVMKVICGRDEAAVSGLCLFLEQPDSPDNYIEVRSPKGRRYQVGRTGRAVAEALEYPHRLNRISHSLAQRETLSEQLFCFAIFALPGLAAAERGQRLRHAHPAQSRAHGLYGFQMHFTLAARSEVRQHIPPLIGLKLPVEQ